MQLTRRSAIGLGVAAVAVAGCHDKTPKAAPTPTATPTPDGAALAQALSDELDLLAAYDHLIKHAPLHHRGPLQVERAIHATHLAALHGDDKPTGHRHGSIKTSLRSSATRLRRLALDATGGANAALLASIAASHTASLS